MSRAPLPIQQLKQNETEIAVLHVQFENIVEKVDDLKTGMKELWDHIDKHTGETQQLIRDFQEENVAAHEKVETKISELEKWRWMLMGAGILAGAVGFPVIEKLLAAAG